MRKFVLAIIIFALFGGGCCLRSRYSDHNMECSGGYGHWHYRCDWCNEPCANTKARFKMMTQKKHREWAKDFVLWDDQENRFCTLRCKVAFAAANGVREERQRVIHQRGDAP